MIHNKSHVFPFQAPNTQEHSALSVLFSSCKRDNAPIFWRWTKNSCQSCPPFLNATFSRWKHLLSTFTVNDRSITRSSFEINVLIPRRDAMTSDALIDRRIPDIRSLTNKSSVLGLVDQWGGACHGLVTCCDGSHHWHVVCHALRVDKSSMWRHLQTRHLSSSSF